MARVLLDRTLAVDPQPRMSDLGAKGRTSGGRWIVELL